MVSDQDMATAKRISTRWKSNAVYSSEDAFQEMMLKVLTTGVAPERDRMRGRIMKGAAISKAVESSYLMRIPYTSWSRNGTPSHIKHTGLSLSESGSLGVPDDDLSKEDLAFGRVETREALKKIMATLPDRNRRILWRWATNPSSVTGGQDRVILRRSIQRLQELVKGEAS